MDVERLVVRVGHAEAHAPAVLERAGADLRRDDVRAGGRVDLRREAIEAELEPLSAESRDAEAWLASAEAYEEPNRERLQATLKRRGEISERIAKLEEDWLWNQAQLERALGEAS